jgi:hypothetical protein
MFNCSNVDRFTARIFAALVVAATVVMALLANAVSSVQVVA